MEWLQPQVNKITHILKKKKYKTSDEIWIEERKGEMSNNNG